MGDPAPRCANRLKAINIALQNYHQEYGTYPPAISRNAEGEPMHSWRVLILPFMEETELYELYDFSQPWDSKDNKRLLRTMPDVYSCPHVSDSGSTPFLAIVGDGMAWSETGAVKLSDFSDGLENTILLMEVPDKAVPWTKPADLHIPSEGLADIFGTGGSDLEFVNVAIADGRVYGVSTSMQGEELKPALTRASGDTFDTATFKKADDH